MMRALHKHVVQVSPSLCCNMEVTTCEVKTFDIYIYINEEDLL